MTKSIKKHVPGVTINRLEQDLRPIIRCPITGKQSQATEFMNTAGLKGQITWWRCEACQNWHILDANQNKK